MWNCKREASEGNYGHSGVGKCRFSGVEEMSSRGKGGDGGCGNEEGGRRIGPWRGREAAHRSGGSGGIVGMAARRSHAIKARGGGGLGGGHGGGLGGGHGGGTW